MSLGMGLASFMQGFRGGMEAREGIEDRRERRLDRQEARETRARDRADRDSLAAIGSRANEDIAGGQSREDVEQRYWREIQDEYARQGRPESARQFQQWVAGDEAKRGIRHFQNGMMLFEMARLPDGTYDPRMMQRGLGELRRAQAITAYGGDRSFSFRPIVEGEGEGERTIGFRIEFKGDDGETATRDIRPEDVPRAATTLFNPQAAFEDRQKQDAERRKREEGRRTEERSDWQKSEEQVRKEYEERRTDPTRRDPAPMRPWSELTDDERDGMIRGRTTSRTPPSQRPAAATGLAGAGTSPGPRIAFDRFTGQAAAPPAGPAAPAGSAPPPVPAVPAPTPGPGSTTGTPSAISEIMRAPPVTEEARRTDSIRAGAQAALDRGETPDTVAAGLQRAGIPIEAWPESIRAAVQRRQQSMPSAGRPLGLSVGGAR